MVTPAQIPLELDVVRPRLDVGALCCPEERAVAGELRWGRARARQIEELAAAVDLPGRRVQDVISHLLMEHHWPIGTAMSAPFGNYLIDGRLDLEQTVALLRARGLSHLARAAALKRMTLTEYLRSLQYELELQPNTNQEG